VSTVHPSRVEELFLAAIDLPVVERKPFLARACGQDEALRREVESLLDHAHDDTFMDSKVAPGRGLLTQLGAVALTQDEPLLPPDRRIGPYEIRGVLGSGGMGVVYVAQQARPKRTVAIKVMRRVLGGVSGVSGQRMLRRFEHEAELLGRLQHPGIAQVFEAGTYSVAGETHPYIAMELVKGQPLLAYADRQGLGSRARLELFARICDAVQHAHRHGVIHRDLKPANILVDDTGQPRILDFGVARATDRDFAVTSQHTAVGQLIGTLAYMSPEQVVGDQQQVDTRSDVYALGVVLYELLTGKLPYDLSSRSLPEAARLIRDHEPTRLSTIDRVFRGDVETIVSKALEKERDRRYQSASDLGDDVRRYLTGEPIAARRDSALYILGKQMKRYRALVALGVRSFLVVLALAIFASVQAINARTAAGQERLAKESAQSALHTAQTERERADQSAVRLARQLDTSRLERGRLSSLTGNLGVAEELIWPAHLRDPESRSTFYALWEMYMHQPLMATVPGGEGRPWGLASSPSGRFLATTVDSRTIRLVDCERLAIHPTSREHPLPIAPPVFLDDRRLLVADTSGRLMVYSVPDLQPEALLATLGSAVRIMTLSPDGQRLAAAIGGGTVVVLETTSGAVVHRLAVGRDAINGLEFSPDSQLLAAAGHERVVRVFEGDRLIASMSGHTEQINGVVFSADGRRVWTGSNDRTVRVWDIAEQRQVRLLDHPNGFARPVARLPDGRIATAGWWWLLLWDESSDRPVRQFSLPQGVNFAVPGPGESLWSVDPQGFRLWDTNRSPGRVEVRGRTPHTGRAMARWDAKGEAMASVDGAGWVRTFTSTGEPLAEHRAASDRLRTLAWHPTEPIIAVAGGSNDRLTLLRAEGGSLEPLATWDGVRAVSSQSLGFSPDGTVLAVCEPSGHFALRRVPTGEILQRFQTAAGGGESVLAQFSPDGTLLAVANRTQGLRVFRLSDGELLYTVRYNTAPWAVAFAPHRPLLFVGTWEKLIHEYDVRTGEHRRSFSGHQGFIHDLTFRTNEPQTLVSSSADGTVRYWDLDRETEQNVLTLTTDNGYDAMCVQFNPQRPEFLLADGQGRVVRVHTRYFNRHIGGNFRAQLERFTSAGGTLSNPAAVQDQLQRLERLTVNAIKAEAR
jgi:WD40 repeat protein